MEGSALLASVGRTLSGSSAETRQLLRRLSARVSTRLLSGYRSLSMGSDDVERHEYGVPAAAPSLAAATSRSARLPCGRATIEPNSLGAQCIIVISAKVCVYPDSVVDGFSHQWCVRTMRCAECACCP